MNKLLLAIFAFVLLSLGQQVCAQQYGIQIQINQNHVPYNRYPSNPYWHFNSHNRYPSSYYVIPHNSYPYSNYRYVNPYNSYPYSNYPYYNQRLYYYGNGLNVYIR